jgi:alkyl hydroperoxide reductase subunit AhpC
VKFACLEVAQTLIFWKGNTMPGRERNVQIKFRVTAEERKIIAEKMRLLHTNNLAAYLRKSALDGYILMVDHSDIKAMTAEIQRIGNNVNQIARRANSTGNVYKEDLEEIERALAEIWRLQRLNLLRER